jgi:23S rRNA (adenine2030-N6)-methyltransferase
MMLCELHPNEYQGLKDFMGHKKNVAIHHSDGYNALNALLPPNPRRGLVFIDPPFEKEDELARLQADLQVALTKWPEGTYAIWYPIKNNDQHVQLLKIIDGFAVNTVKAEMVINEDPTSTKLIGTGMVILNPPWQFELQLQKLVPWLWTYLSDEGEGHYLTASN